MKDLTKLNTMEALQTLAKLELLLKMTGVTDTRNLDEIQEKLLKIYNEKD